MVLALAAAGDDTSSAIFSSPLASLGKGVFAKAFLTAAVEVNGVVVWGSLRD